MRGNIVLGRVLGITVRLHYSWFIIAFLITFSLGAGLRAEQPGWSPALVWTTAAATAVLFFVCLLLHELSHSVVARAHGVSVRAITLFALGGVSEAAGENPDAGTEFLVGIVGPATSAVLGAACLAGSRLLHAPSAPQFMLLWLGRINLVLAVFNMIPGYPLDGGRVLRAALWRWYGDVDHATRAAAGVGRFVAVLFMLWGALQFFVGRGVGGLWLAFIGFFLFEASGASLLQAQARRALSGLPLSEVMDRDYPVIDGETSLDAFAERLLRGHRRSFIVRRQGRLAGLITPRELRPVAASLWTRVTVSEAMIGLERLPRLPPQASVWDALETMGREGVDELAVVERGELVGLVTRAAVATVLATRRELSGRSS